MFQFTRPRGGAILSTNRIKGRNSFNSHAPVGARCFFVVTIRSNSVSIHTPPWGRDTKRVIVGGNDWFQFTRPRGGAIPIYILTKSLRPFQFTRPRGGAILVILIVSLPILFQFTRPRGGAIARQMSRNIIRSFNSHAPVGARCSTSNTSLFLDVSIHTPPWGRDLSRSFLYKRR